MGIIYYSLWIQIRCKMTPYQLVAVSGVFVLEGPISRQYRAFCFFDSIVIAYCFLGGNASCA